VELLVRVRTDGADHDLRIDADPQVRVEALARELVARFGRPAQHGAGRAGAPALFRGTSGERLDPAGSLGAAGLLSGDLVTLGDPPEPVPPPPAAGTDGVSLDVVAGPEAGRSVVLSPRRYLLGRSGECDITIGDPTVSRRQLAIEVRHGAPPLITSQADATQTLLLDGVPNPRPFELGDDSVVQVGATAFVIRRFTRSVDAPRDRLGQVPFHRTPYRPSLIKERAFAELADIPKQPERRRFAVLTALAPLGGGLMMFAFSGQKQFLALTLLTPVTVGANWFEDKRSGKRKYLSDADRFRDAVKDRRREVDAALQAERVERMRAAPDVADLARRAEFRTVDLWPRGRDADDFLALRAGLGDVASRVEAPVAAQGEASLREEAAGVLAGHEELRSVPVVVELAKLGTFALHGEDTLVERVAASLILQAATLHSPEDLVVLAALSSARLLADQLKWLPHTRTLNSPLAGRHVVNDPAGVQALCTELVAVARRRVGGADRDVDRRWPWLLVVLDAELEPDPALVAQILDRSPAAGISVVWLGRSVRVPRQAQAVLNCIASEVGPSELWFRDPERKSMRLEVEPVQPGVTDRAVRALAPLRDASAVHATSAIPRVVPLFAALGLDDAAEAAPPGARGDAAAERPGPRQGLVHAVSQRLVERWLADRGYTLEAPLGITAEGVMTLDLVTAGPHALVGGTSGSGKSELLVALVAGLVANFPPTRLTLLFVDYKGGAASAAFRDSPHTVGYVTNLNGDLATRALVSLRAELNRRMQLLEGRAKDLEEMLAQHPEEAPPSLVIVVDEFATLVKEVPEFVPGIVDIAQRGRSLGIHLILATQRPSGAVNDNILANTNARISLRMLDGAESNSIIGRPDAAAIPVPLRGRAFAKLGPGELIAFQSAYGGAALDEDETVQVHIDDFQVGGGRGRSRAAGRSAVPGAGAPTQLEALLEAVALAAETLQLPRPKPPWLNELPPRVGLADVLAGAGPGGAGMVVPFGMFDDPVRSDQGTAGVDLEEGGGLLVFGSGGSGKTTVLRTIAASAVQTAGPGGVTIFAVDFASRSLRALEALDQCAAVAPGDDLEAVTRVLSILESEVRRRRALLGGAETLSAHVADGGGPLTRVLLLVDGYTAMRDTFQGEGTSAAMQGWLDRFHRLVTEGRQVGIHTVVTADRAGAVPPVLYSSVARRLILRQVDERGLTELGVPMARARGLELGPGRGLLDAELLVQVASVGEEDDDGAAQAAGLRSAGRRFPGVVPAELAGRALGESETLPLLASRRPLQAVLGVADVTHAPVVVDLADGHLIAAGPPRSGRSTALETILASLGTGGADVYVAGLASSPLRRLGLPGRTAFGNGDELAALAGELLQVVQIYPEVLRVLVIDDADRLLEDMGLSGAFDALARCDPVRVVATMETSSLMSGYSQSALLQQLKKGRRRLLLQPVDDGETQSVIGMRFPLRPGLAMPPGRGVLLADRSPVVVQVGLPGSAQRAVADGRLSPPAAIGPPIRGGFSDGV
jgi:S-DNA-T family DNA segregation ATPase FtsK/SpoIIIE